MTGASPGALAENGNAGRRLEANLVRYLVALIVTVAACGRAPASREQPQTLASAPVAGSVSHGASLDSTIQFLLRSAAADFHAHRPPDPVRFRDVRLGHTTSSRGERRYRLCGQFLPAEEGKAEWTPFTTIQTSGYEQWLGAQAAGYCQGASFAWDSVGDLSSSLWSRFESLR